jgi:hypothetical protein
MYQMHDHSGQVPQGASQLSQEYWMMPDYPAGDTWSQTRLEHGRNLTWDGNTQPFDPHLDGA